MAAASWPHVVYVGLAAAVVWLGVLGIGAV
jgi:hypothetical protein